MSSAIHKDQPVGSNGLISREQLLAYAEGRATPDEQFQLELWMENDPLLEEAAEGMALPGAATGLMELDRSRPGGGMVGAPWGFIGLVIVAGSIGFGLWQMENTDQAVVTAQRDPIGIERGTPIEDRPGAKQLEAAEKAEDSEISAEELSLPKDNAPAYTTEAFRRDALVQNAPVEREPPTEKIAPKPVEPETIRTEVASGTLNANERSPGHQLHYLHDLKLIHPKELYPIDPLVRSEMDHVPASHGDRDAQLAAEQEAQVLEYLPYMDEALGHFARQQYGKSLRELRFLLQQYPDDVNALFYAGLCNFHLGRLQAARIQLDRAATHTFAVFHEEARWYHAQTLERSGETEAAQREFAAIAEKGGFYADRARERLK